MRHYPWILFLIGVLFAPAPAAEFKLTTPEATATILVPEGYHPVVAAHGYNVYYLNALAGSAHSMAAADDPDYAWVRKTWTEQDPRLPLVK